MLRLGTLIECPYTHAGEWKRDCSFHCQVAEKCVCLYFSKCCTKFIYKAWEEAGGERLGVVMALLRLQGNDTGCRQKCQDTKRHWDG